MDTVFAKYKLWHWRLQVLVPYIHYEQTEILIKNHVLAWYLNWQMFTIFDDVEIDYRLSHISIRMISLH